MDQFNKMLARCEPMVLSIFRIMVGLLLFQYGVAKILKFPVLPYFANIPPLIVFAGWIELVLGALLACQQIFFHHRSWPRLLTTR